MASPADKLRLAREAVGKSIPQLALEAGTNENAIWDLETYDDEAHDAVSLEQLANISRACGISMRFLFDDGAHHSTRGQISFQTLHTRLMERLSQNKLSVEQFGDEVGWDLSGFLRDHENAWGWNVVCVRDVAIALGVQWLDVLPLVPRSARQ